MFCTHTGPDKDIDRKLLPSLALTGIIFACLGLALPVFLFFYFPEFKDKLFFTGFFLAIAIERFWFSLFTSKEKTPVNVSQDWTFVAVGYAYTLMMIFTILEFYVNQPKSTPASLTITGFVLLIASILLRYRAVKTLGDQWAIHVERDDTQGRRLVKSGPYRYIRHPIYLAAMFEVIGIPVIFGSFYTLVYSLLTCIPLQILRARFEDKNSIEIFGEEYIRYMETTSAFCPINKNKP